MKSREEIEREVEFIIASVLSDTLCGTNVMETRNKVLPKVMSLFDEVLAERDEAKGEAERAKQLHHSDGEKLLARARAAERLLREVLEQFNHNGLKDNPVAVDIFGFLMCDNKPFEEHGMSPYSPARCPTLPVEGHKFILDPMTPLPAVDPRDLIRKQDRFTLPCYVDDDGHICEVESGHRLNRPQLAHLCNIAYDAQRNYNCGKYWEDTARKRSELHSDTASRNMKLQSTVDALVDFICGTVDWNDLPAEVREKGRELLKRHAIATPVSMMDVVQRNGVKFSDLCPGRKPALAEPVLPPFPWRTGEQTGCGVFDAKGERVAGGASADAIGESGKVADGSDRDRMTAAFIVRVANDYARKAGLLAVEGENERQETAN